MQLFDTPHVSVPLHNIQGVIHTTFLGAFEKLRKATINFVVSVRPHGTTGLPLDGLWWNLLFELFFLKSVEKIRFIKIWQE